MNTIQDSVFIVLVNYNSWKDTVECVESILKCDYEGHSENSGYKICVVDNASTDDSLLQLEKRYKFERDNTHLISSPKNLGFSGGNNIGITYALEHGAEYILLLNNDTIVDSDFLNELVACSKRYADKAAVGPKIYYEGLRTSDGKGNTLWYAGGEFNFKTARSKHHGINEFDKGQYNKEKEVSFITGCCILIHKNIIEETGLLPEEYFLYCEDLAYSIELLRAGFKLIYNPKSIIYHKVSASTGRDSKTSVYYSVRNKLYIIKEYVRLPWKIPAQIIFLLENLKRVLFKRYGCRAVLIGYKDYYKGIKGKRSF